MNTAQNISINRKMKDSLFTDIFSRKENTADLYHSLHPEEEIPAEEDIEIITLTQVFAYGQYNDLGFQVGDHIMVFAEAQSTWSINILVRFLLYYAQSLMDRFTGNEWVEDLYRTRKMVLPKVEFYVVYTGEAETEEEYRLKDVFFNGRDDIDLKARVIHKAGHDTLIGQYLEFINILQKETEGKWKDRNEMRKAVNKAIDTAIENDILKVYLLKHRREIMEKFIDLISQEAIEQERKRKEDRLAKAYEEEKQKNAELTKENEENKARIKELERLLAEKEN